MPKQPLSPERLAVFTPFSKLDEAQRILLCHQIEVQSARAGDELSPLGDNRQQELFLLSGRVSLQQEDRSRLLAAGDERSRFSLLGNRPSNKRIACLSDCDYFLLDSELIHSLQAEYSAPVPPLADLLAQSNQHPIITRFYRALGQGQLTLPALPEVTRKVSQIIVDDELSTRHIASLVAADASVSARLMKLANSSFYRGRSAVSRLPEAVIRLGMDTTRHLVLAFALQEMHQPHSGWIRKRLLRSWKESIQLAALCYVLAKKCTRIPPEEAMLAGLLHNIGELPLLAFAEQFPELAEEPDYLDQIIQEARGQAGAMILHRWNLPAGLITAVQHVDTWFYQANEAETSLTDILILARLHSLAMREDAPPAPDITQVPSYEKVSPGALNEQQHLEILVDAKEQILEIKSLFNR